MIHVRDLTKYYDDYPAVRDVSFDVLKGQIVGFLGPNGAGKSTTMRILAGYLTATSGQVTIDGFDVFWQPIEVRRRIGYMPENCPLYPEMRVSEYLHFRAGIKGVHGVRRRQRIDYVVKRCWITDVQRQLIGTLSKGYRQRVGLADALLGDPKVLILDEPTAGLDPAQIRSARDLIRDLGQEHTILLSTHILPEVEMTCSDVIIIARGRVAVAGSMADLVRRAGEQGSLHVMVEGQIDPEPARALAGVTDVSAAPVGDGTRLEIASADPNALAPYVYALAVERGWKLRELTVKRQTLEDLFVRVTTPESTGPARVPTSVPSASAALSGAATEAVPSTSIRS
jgi:ABC-2 type transport system ATP-binding protein